jgi:hypothetical protein
MHPRCGRFRVNGYVCDKSSPFPNLSRNLFLRAGFLPHPCQRRSIAQRNRATSSLGLDAPPCHGAAKTPLALDQVNVLLLLFGGETSLYRESSSEDHGEELSGMGTPGCESIMIFIEHFPSGNFDNTSYPRQISPPPYL